MYLVTHDIIIYIYIYCVIMIFLLAYYFHYCPSQDIFGSFILKGLINMEEMEMKCSKKWMLQICGICNFSFWLQLESPFDFNVEKNAQKQ